jgi:hypothetical protein
MGQWPRSTVPYYLSGHVFNPNGHVLALASTPGQYTPVTAVKNKQEPPEGSAAKALGKL